jgi:hypothetical protein
MDRRKLEIATAVLDAIAGFRDADSSDKDLLRNLAESAEEIDMPIDELARTVILREIERSGYQRQQVARHSSA